MVDSKQDVEIKATRASAGAGPKPREEQELEEFLGKIIRAEVNLLLFPFFALNRREVKRRKITEFRTLTERDGVQIEILWQVSANPTYGYPGPFDKEVFRTIEQMIYKQVPVKNPFKFSTYEVLRKMGRKDSGYEYQQFRRALERIAATTIKAQSAFYNKNKRRWEGGVFNLYDIYFKGMTLPDGSIAETNYIFLNELYLQSLNSHYVKPLDWDYYKSLKNAIAQRLYEILGVKFYGLIKRSKEDYIRYKYSTLCQLIPMAQQRYPSKAREKMTQAHQKLVETGFLASVEWDGWFIYYTPGPRAFDEMARWDLPELPEIEEAPDSQLVAKVMRTLNIPQEAAENLVRRHTPRELEEHLLRAAEERKLP